ncbi:MAG: hypothetical protein ACREQI_07620 [Candidatus Binataceae bacterium]
MRLSPLNYRSLLILYGVCAAVLFAFAGVYVYAHHHGWTGALPILLIAGVGTALIVWARLEPRLLAAQPAQGDLNVVNLVVPEVVFAGVMATTAAVSVAVFAPPQVLKPDCAVSDKAVAIRASSLKLVILQDEGMIPVAAACSIITIAA